MKKLKKGEVIPELEDARNEFDAWRTNRVGGVRGRIPEHLWSLAVKLASEYGVGVTQQALRLNRKNLKERMERTDGGQGECERPNFVELGNNWASPGGQVVEIESAGGWKMRVELSNSQQIDVADLARSFFGALR